MTMARLNKNINLDVFGVYILYDPRNDLPVYVGKTKNPDRPQGHINEARTGKRGKRDKNNLKFCKLKSILAQNLEIKVEWYKTGLTNREACDLEIELISKFGRIDLGTGSLTNVTAGGDGWMSKHTAIAKEKITKALLNRDPIIYERLAEQFRGTHKTAGMLGKHHISQTKLKMSQTHLKMFLEGKRQATRLFGEDNGFYGKNHTDEAKKAMSDWKKENYAGEGNPFYGKTHSDEAKKKISANTAFRRPEIRQKAIDALKGKPWPAARRAAYEKSKLLKLQNKENQQ
jgi:hypothetical protein